MFWSPRLLGTFTTLPFLFSNTLLLRLCLFRCKTFFVKRFHHLRVFVSLYNDSQTTNQFRLPENSLVKHKKLFTKFFFRKPFSNLLPTPHLTPSALSLSFAQPLLLLSLPVPALSSKTFLSAPALYRTKFVSLSSLSHGKNQPTSSISHGKPPPPFFNLTRKTPTPFRLTSQICTLDELPIDVVAGCGGPGCSWLVGF
jgi:hypothetical protein